MSKVEVSVVIPAYNEAENLERDLDRISAELYKLTKSYEIIIAEDGCTDNSNAVAEKLRKLKKYNGRVKHLHSDVRLGRGRALNRAFKFAKGNILIYMDSDLATDLKHTKELIDSIKNGADFATGSRYAKGANAVRQLKREIASRTYNFLVRFLFNSKVKDHQCGFKSFKRSSLMKIIDDIKDNHWFWDTELLIRAQKKGYKIVEFPVNWHYGKGTKVNVLHDSLDMGRKLIELRLRG